MHSLENLRLLSNLETRKHKLIQIVIAGQPELDAILRRQELRQLTQRINLKRYVIPFSEKETNDYIQHRLTVADFKGSHLFDRRAQKLIWEYSHGIPRKINILCDNALLTGYGVKKKRITTSLMAEAIKDLTWIPFAPSGAPPNQIATGKIEKRRWVTTRLLPRRLPLAAGLALMAVIIFGLGLILGRPDLGWRENIMRLSGRVFQSQKTSQGGGAGRTPTTELPGEDVQARIKQTVVAERVPTEKVEAVPVPAGKAKDEPVPTEEVKAASVLAEKIETEPVPALEATTTLPPAEELEAARVPAESRVAASGPAEKAEAEPAPASGVTMAPAPVKEVETTPVLAEELEAARVSAEDAVATGVSTDKVDPESAAAATQANVLPESVGGITEEIKKEAPQLTQKETTKDSDASQVPELPRQRLPLALSIRPGDTLTEIITQHYGSYNKETLRAVLNENPEIQNPDLIFAGEILKLPLASEKP
jgi:hypothetical protein